MPPGAYYLASKILVKRWCQKIYSVLMQKYEPLSDASQFSYTFLRC